MLISAYRAELDLDKSKLKLGWLSLEPRLELISTQTPRVHFMEDHQELHMAWKIVTQVECNHFHILYLVISESSVNGVATELVNIASVMNKQWKNFSRSGQKII